MATHGPRDGVTLCHCRYCHCHYCRALPLQVAAAGSSSRTRFPPANSSTALVRPGPQVLPPQFYSDGSAASHWLCAHSRAVVAGICHPTLLKLFELLLHRRLVDRFEGGGRERIEGRVRVQSPAGQIKSAEQACPETVGVLWWVGGIAQAPSAESAKTVGW